MTVGCTSMTVRCSSVSSHVRLLTLTISISLQQGAPGVPCRHRSHRLHAPTSKSRSYDRHVGGMGNNSCTPSDDDDAGMRLPGWMQGLVMTDES